MCKTPIQRCLDQPVQIAELRIPSRVLGNLRRGGDQDRRIAADREVGEHLVRHPGINKVSFTGSTIAGKKIGGICGEQLKRFSLELGGKSAAVLLDDVDLSQALPMLLPNALMNNGEACIAQTRILAPRDRY